MTGFRVAPGGAQAAWELDPDLTCLGKVIGGGLPVGAYAGKREIMSTVAPVGDVYQAGTLSGNPLAMTAGLVTVRRAARARGVRGRRSATRGAGERTRASGREPRAGGAGRGRRHHVRPLLPKARRARQTGADHGLRERPRPCRYRAVRALFSRHARAVRLPGPPASSRPASSARRTATRISRPHSRPPSRRWRRRRRFLTPRKLALWGCRDVGMSGCRDVGMSGCRAVGLSGRRDVGTRLRRVEGCDGPLSLTGKGLG